MGAKPGCGAKSSSPGPSRRATPFSSRSHEFVHTALLRMIQVELVTAANARILDRIDEDVFDFPVQPVYAEAFLASPTNLLVVAVEAETVVGMATGLLYTH